MKNLFFFAIFSLCAFSATAQHQLSGTITDGADGSPVPFATAALLRADSTVVTGVMADAVHTFPASSITAIEATTYGGSIIVTGNACSEAVVEVYFSNPEWSDQKIKQTLEDNYTFDIKVEGGKLYAAVKTKKNYRSVIMGGISLIIIVPEHVNSKLETIPSGDISIRHLSGSLNFKTVGGSITVENVSGKVAGYTVGGNINISNFDGDFDANTTGGNIMASNIRGTFKIGTASGNVNLNLISGNLNASTTSGNMNIKVESVDKYVKLSNARDIKLYLPAEKGFNLKVSADEIETTGLNDFRGKMDDKSIDGTLGDGGPFIEINTVSVQGKRKEERKKLSLIIY